MRIAIIGSAGQLGQDLMKTLPLHHEVVGLTHQDIDVIDCSSLLRLKEQKPDVIINTAAFHKTDQCEDEPLKTFSVNAIGPKNVAAVSNEIQATTVFISTDYVFSGSKNEPYTEDDAPDPINTYGISKLAGELFTKQNSRHYIFRVASLFGVAGASGKGGNFVETMIAKAQKNEPIRVVDDMWMSPTYTKDAAETIKKVLELQLPYGTYHLTNTGCCTWFQFAREIFKFANLTPDLEGIKTNQIPTKAKRPVFSALKSVKLPQYGLEMRNWREALYDYLVEKGHVSKQ
ncbi:dTDP-4-dehydrorhamnose reductase [Candidatus Bathyarchaeota archaeon A05DMB-2]|jgi:dTDP-4-dehydrorhamnose reductase|nr:dTDP-4-dehydrorhamnose reductase [Candidatus Bathyarchaeota archaeon A05DMB-2]